MRDIDKSLSKLKVPPHSMEAEQAVLGGLLIDVTAWDKIAGILMPEDFYRQEHKTIFSTINNLVSQNTPIDSLTVSQAIDNEKLSLGYVAKLAANTPSAANILAYAKIVKERSILRQLITVATDITENAYNPEDKTSSDLLDEAERKVFSIAEHGRSGEDGPQPIAEIFATAIDKIEYLYESGNEITGLSTGFNDLDKLTSGLHPADLIIVAGRPSMGKTSLAMNIAEHAAIKNSKPILVFSLEMPADAIAMRILSSMGRIEQQKLRSGQLQDNDWPKLTSAISMLSNRKLLIDDSGGLSPSEMRARARRVAREHGELGLIVIDYLQLMKVSGKAEHRALEISEISRSLKALAKELNVPVIALSQLNRSVEQRPDKRPLMSDLRESGAIEQDADLIVFIYRDEFYNKESQDKGVAEIIVAKQRNGPVGTVKLTYLGHYAKFENFAHEQYSGV